MAIMLKGLGFLLSGSSDGNAIDVGVWCCARDMVIFSVSKWIFVHLRAQHEGPLGIII